MSVFCRKIRTKAIVKLLFCFKIFVKDNVSVKSKLQHAPPRAALRAFDFFENYCSNSPLPGPAEIAATRSLNAQLFFVMLLHHDHFTDMHHRSPY